MGLEFLIERATLNTQILRLYLMKHHISFLPIKKWFFGYWNCDFSEFANLLFSRFVCVLCQVSFTHISAPLSIASISAPESM